ncbi:hypothetical protein PR003_g10719 [Phytophthora rubi]|uniref:ShKT domain-containing protein n=1 Tax=Phytophthora rubi TaxID=129364 RepID=A0A6A3LL26_9STRA|nr:hypothetical protein PR001_g13657 [Phytophthora rubi]KAE9340030.1 hypothetical protein PR003_g10719 [Phytophthora rubi]
MPSSFFLHTGNRILLKSGLVMLVVASLDASLGVRSSLPLTPARREAVWRLSAKCSTTLTKYCSKAWRGMMGDTNCPDSC